MRVCAILFVSSLADVAMGLSVTDRNRRQLVGTAFTASMGCILLPTAPSNAFDNRISTQYDDRPKQRGPQPPDLGVKERINFEGDAYQGLRNCGAAPNCFSSTMVDDPDHNIPAFEWPSNLDQTQAMQQLQQVLESYPPGQNGIDGGGFQIQKAAQSYIYVQYQSLKHGYIDDMEFAIIDSGYPKSTVQVRSSSRIGYLDFGVNSKRINWVAKALREKGWKAVGVDYKEHRGYAIENEVAI